MGVAGLWDDFADVAPLTLMEWSSEFWYQHSRAPIVAIDMPIFKFQIMESTREWGFSNFHHQFIRRVTGFINAGIVVVGVFDGPLVHSKLRHKRAGTRRQMTSKALTFMKDTLKYLGALAIDAPGEAEAQCCKMQLDDVVDAVFSSDADCFCFGGRTVIRYAKKSECPDSKLPDTAILRYVKVARIGAGQNDATRLSYILRAVLQGNDFDAGIGQLSFTYAKEAAAPRAGFTDELRRILQLPEGRQLEAAIQRWLDRLSRELRTNKSKFFSRRKTNFTIPPDFPNLELVRLLAQPRVTRINAWIPRTHKVDASGLKKLWLADSPIKGSDPNKHLRKTRTQPPEEACANAIAGCLLLYLVLSGQISKAHIKSITVTAGGEANVTLHEPLPLGCSKRPSLPGSLLGCLGLEEKAGETSSTNGKSTKKKGEAQAGVAAFFKQAISRSLPAISEGSEKTQGPTTSNQRRVDTQVGKHKPKLVEEEVQNPAEFEWRGVLSDSDTDDDELPPFNSCTPVEGGATTAELAHRASRSSRRATDVVEQELPVETTSLRASSAVNLLDSCDTEMPDSLEPKSRSPTTSVPPANANIAEPGHDLDNPLIRPAPVSAPARGVLSHFLPQTSENHRASIEKGFKKLAEAVGKTGDYPTHGPRLSAKPIGKLPFKSVGIRKARKSSSVGQRSLDEFLKLQRA